MLGGATASAEALTGAGNVQVTVTQAAVRAEPGPINVQGDGCTWAPDQFYWANFRPACDAHDNCYSSGSRTPRLVCDDVLRGSLKVVCAGAFGPSNPLRAGCYSEAETFYVAVRTLGKPHYQGSGNPY
ncbi:phospholipase A2 [Amycolatopsis sp. A133]|uniref:phospholipase A2 n=1 Tax=Amycolatopsis sp. A133 TaxID=3064472 RepID=UPI0037C0D2F1